MKMNWSTLKSNSTIKWNDGGHKSLYFSAYHKPNQRLKYLNKGSTHKNTVFHAIPKGVFQRLAELTTFDASNEKLIVDQVYPLHAEKLRVAGLVRGNFPVLKECLKKDDNADEMVVKENGIEDDVSDVETKTSSSTAIDHNSVKYDPRSSYISLRYCDCWKKNFVPKLVRKLKLKYHHLN